MTTIPLAERLRPVELDRFAGQKHLVGADGIITKLLTKSCETNYFPSLIFWGPPGCGKTTLARIIASKLNKPFYEFSAVNTSVKDILAQVNINSIKRKTARQLQPSLNIGEDLPVIKQPLVFIDEIHRFNKAQQDALLPLVEQGHILFIGATTENPSFEVIGPLLSRTRVVLLYALEEQDLEILLVNALKELNTSIKDDAKNYILQASNGDARTLLNLVELAFHVNLAVNAKEREKVITKEDVKQALQKNYLTFDLKGEEYYNTISALHKSIRGSDPNAALYWLARMLEAGQDPIYIARRLIRLASEDIGLLDPNALALAVATFSACEKIGMPECNLALAELVVYLAKSPKSNQLYLAYTKAADDVHKYGNLPVPLHIRNAPTKLMKEIGCGKGYKYEHSVIGEKNRNIEYLPENINSHKYI